MNELGFGAGCGGSGFMLDGWAEPEDGFAWAIGQESRFRLAGLTDPGPAMLELDLNPFVLPGSARGQRLAVLVDGLQIGADRILGEGTVGYRLPPCPSGPSQDRMVTLLHPDATRPAALGFNDDARELGFMVRRARVIGLPADPPVSARPRPLPPIVLPSAANPALLVPALRSATGLDAAALVEGFESLGHNCEFGMVQRHCGAEPLGLFRFAGVTLPDLLRGLEQGFAGLGEDAQVEAFAHGPLREFLVRDRRYTITIHTRRHETDIDAETVRREQAGQLRFFHRSFLEMLETGERLFVFQRPGQTLPAQMLPLLARLRRHGPNALLFVTDDAAHPPGSVEQLGYGLFRGFTDRMAPEDDVGRCNLSAWLSLCANARRLWAAQQAEARA